MADSPIRDGGDQPLDDEKPLRTAADTHATPRAHGETGEAPLPGGDAAGPLDGRDEPGGAGEQPPVPTGGEPPAPDPDVAYDGQADFVADATGERYTRDVQDGIERIDEHKARIAELEAERADASDAGEPLEPGPDVPGVPDAAGAAPDAPVPTAQPGADAPEGPGVLRPPSGGDDASGLDDPYDGGAPR